MASPNADGFYREEGRPGLGGIDYCPYGQADCLTVGGRGLCECGLPQLRSEQDNPAPSTLLDPPNTPVTG